MGMDKTYIYTPANIAAAHKLRDEVIPKLYESGMTLEAIGELYGISRQRVYQIVIRDKMAEPEKEDNNILHQQANKIIADQRTLTQKEGYDG